MDISILKDYFEGRKVTPIHNKASEMYNEFRVHSDGEFPLKLIGERRPHEPEYILKYRKQIYESKTKTPISKVITSLGGIRRSSDWSIKYKAEVPAKIATGESLEYYCEKKYPYYTSVTNWVFSDLLKNYLIDPNALVLIKPLNKPQGNEYTKPFTFIFNSCDVIEYLEGQFAILKRDVIYDSKEKKEFVVIDTNEIKTWTISNDLKSYTLIDTYVHGLGYLPIAKLRATLKKTYGENPLYESRISGMIPELNEAVREYSDQQANIVTYLYPERWEYESEDCPACKNGQGISTGKVLDGKNKAIKCSSCGGSGKNTVRSPYKTMIVRQANKNLGEQSAPIPPFGYVSKDTNIIDVIDKRIEKHIYSALSSINMQFLDQTPLSQSGDAKEVDKDELNKLVYTIAEDLVYVMDEVYKIIADYRYKTILSGNEKEIESLLPSIAVPEKFDLLSSLYLVDEYSKAKSANMSGIILMELQREYCAKKFYNQPEIRDELDLVFSLDPMAGVSEEDKMVIYQNGGVTKQTYIISSNIVSFVKRALKEKENFATLKYQEQMNILKGYADEIIEETTSVVVPEQDTNGL